MNTNTPLTLPAWTPIRAIAEFMLEHGVTPIEVRDDVIVFGPKTQTQNEPHP